jgi:dockerin type I repeat protein
VRILIASSAFACALATASSPSVAQQIFAQTGFNDQRGINADASPGSPYTLGKTVAGRGIGEFGWGDTWQVLDGGALGGDPYAIVRAGAAFEGDGGLDITRAPLGSTVVRRRLARGMTRHFVLETRINFGAVEGFVAEPLEDNYPLAADREGPMWGITGPVDHRHFEVFDGQSNQLGEWEDTGIEQKPGEWQKIVIDANVATQRFTFSVDGVAYNSPDPLGFFNSPAQINAIAYLSTGSGFLDSVIVRADPDLPGDANFDGAVDALDLLLVRQHLGQQNAQWDLNGDGRVNAADLQAVREGMRRAGAAQALASVAPEPSSLALLAAAAALILRRPR